MFPSPTLHHPDSLWGNSFVTWWTLSLYFNKWRRRNEPFNKFSFSGFIRVSISYLWFSLVIESVTIIRLPNNSRFLTSTAIINQVEMILQLGFLIQTLVHFSWRKIHKVFWRIFSLTRLIMRSLVVPMLPQLYFANLLMKRKLSITGQEFRII